MDLGNLMEFQFKATLERAAVIKDVAKDAVMETLNRRRDVHCARRCAIRSSSASC